MAPVVSAAASATVRPGCRIWNALEKPVIRGDLTAHQARGGAHHPGVCGTGAIWRFLPRQDAGLTARRNQQRRRQQRDGARPWP
ncbi:hypothetical protein I552_8647 [Mycobacterium xenopi 3993]|nr:hypothetical protein I552_8647 [Mycobacterium xenopi 3993]